MLTGAKNHQSLRHYDAAVFRAAIKHGDLELEITERQVFEHPPHVEQTVRAFTTKGVQVTIDAFGTACSSPAYITQISSQAAKADRAFMAQIPEDWRGGRIDMLIIGMLQELGRELAAEGINTNTTYCFIME